MTTTPEPMSDGAVGWGILATGGIAHSFVRDLVAHGHRIAAVGSRSQPTARRFADEFGIPKAYGRLADERGVGVTRSGTGALRG